MSRDTVILMLMAFGFGTLLAWGLFYQPISIDKEASAQWPAWVQAIGSLVALAIAIVVPLVLHLREQSAQEQRIAIDHTERERLARIQAKAAAVAVLPVARAFMGALHSMVSQMTDAGIEHYSDLTDEELRQNLDLFRGCSYQLASMGQAGERALDAIASVERLLRALEEWEFYERHTWNGVIDDPERGYYEVFEKPPQLLPIARQGIDRVSAFLQSADAMFD